MCPRFKRLGGPLASLEAAFELQGHPLHEKRSAAMAAGRLPRGLRSSPWFAGQLLAGGGPGHVADLCSSCARLPPAGRSDVEAFGPRSRPGWVDGSGIVLACARWSAPVNACHCQDRQRGDAARSAGSPSRDGHQPTASQARSPRWASSTARASKCVGRAIIASAPNVEHGAATRESAVRAR